MRNSAIGIIQAASGQKVSLKEVEQSRSAKSLINQKVLMPYLVEGVMEQQRVTKGVAAIEARMLTDEPQEVNRARTALIGLMLCGYSVNPTSKQLQSFTDADNKVFTHTYVPAGQDGAYAMKEAFKPANPTTPIVSNVYDSLGRVKEQKNALNQTLQFFFAGFAQRKSIRSATSASSTMITSGKW